MPTEPAWPIPNPRSLSRHCSGPGGGGSSTAATVWDEASLLRTLRGSTPAAARVAQAFLDDCPRVTQRLREALRDGDRTTLQHLAHRLKGNAGILRAPVVRRAAETFESHIDGEDLGPAEPLLRELEAGLARLCDALGAFLAGTGAGNADREA